MKSYQTVVKRRKWKEKYVYMDEKINFKILITVHQHILTNMNEIIYDMKL